VPVRVSAQAADPDDQRFLECAAAANAAYLVSGDKGHLLARKVLAGVRIVSASEFLSLLGLPENAT
jgi:uncharacterized protein